MEKSNCPYFDAGKCQSCEYIGLSYQESLDLKKKNTELILEHKISEFISNKTALYNRNKAKFAIKGKPGELYLTIPSIDNESKIEACPLHEIGINKTAHEILHLLNEYQLEAYDPKTKKGELKFFIITKGANEQYMMKLVIRSKNLLSKLEKIYRENTGYFDCYGVMTVNINPKHTSIIEGIEEFMLSDINNFYIEMDEYNHFLGPSGFFQTNTSMANKLYQYASQFCLQNKILHVLDLYCGSGGFSFAISDQVRNVIGYEVSKVAIHYAKLNSELNHFENTDFEVLDLKKAPHKLNELDLIIVNPPRSGLSEEIIKYTLDIQPRFFFYSSCNPLSLKRDLEFLREKYDLLDIKAFDMFAFSKHTEVVATLELR
jgi:23S rRNA (uracil747-C5)-methyltransferase